MGLSVLRSGLKAEGRRGQYSGWRYDMRYYNVSYFDTLQGGSGLVRIEVDKLHHWLKEHPGYLIRCLSPCWRE